MGRTASREQLLCNLLSEQQIKFAEAYSITGTQLFWCSLATALPIAWHLRWKQRASTSGLLVSPPGQVPMS